MKMYLPYLKANQSDIRSLVAPDADSRVAALRKVCCLLSSILRPLRHAVLRVNRFHSIGSFSSPRLPKLTFSYSYTMKANIAHLMSLEVVRERAQIVYDAAKEGFLNNFDFHEDKLDDVADYVTGIIKVISCFLLITVVV